MCDWIKYLSASLLIKYLSTMSALMWGVQEFRFASDHAKSSACGCWGIPGGLVCRRCRRPGRGLGHCWTSEEMPCWHIAWHGSTLHLLTHPSQSTAKGSQNTSTFCTSLCRRCLGCGFDIPVLQPGFNGSTLPVQGFLLVLVTKNRCAYSCSMFAHWESSFVGPHFLFPVNSMK